MSVVSGSPSHTTSFAPSVDASTTRPPLHGPIVIAVDGSALAGNAARVALAVAGHARATLQIVSVVDSRGVPLPPPLDVAIALADEIVGPAVHAEQATAVRTALGAALGRTVDWPVRVAIGTPSHAIAHEASDAQAGLVVVGLRRHGAFERAMQDDTAVQLMRRIECPVLAVTPGLTALPRHIVVGMDYDRASEDAARLALDLLAPDGTLTLAYAPTAAWHETEEAERRLHALGVDAAFETLMRSLAPPAGITIARAILPEPGPHDRVADRLLACADQLHADLLALGSHRHGRIERWLLGSVVTDAARDGRMSMLVVAPVP